eukprot:g1633.t1
MVANLVMAHELSTNFTQRVFGGGIRLVTSIWAEAICPWFFNPPIHTDSKLIKCYTTSCVTLRRMVSHTALAPNVRSFPYMCKAKKNGKDPSDYFCVKENADCEQYDGRRPCEDRAIKFVGEEGEPGEDGIEGPAGFVSDLAVPVPTGAHHLLSQPATNVEVLSALIVNGGMAFLVFRSLKAKIREKFEGKASAASARATQYDSELALFGLKHGNRREQIDADCLILIVMKWLVLIAISAVSANAEFYAALGLLDGTSYSTQDAESFAAQLTMETHTNARVGCHATCTNALPGETYVATLDTLPMTTGTQ